MPALNPIHLTDEMMALLKAGAESPMNRICFSFEVKNRRSLLKYLEEQGYVYFYFDEPHITNVAREALGYPTALEVSLKCFNEELKEMRAHPNWGSKNSKETDHPYTNKEIARWNKQRMHCILVVRHEHPSKLAIKATRDGSGDFEFLPLSKIQILPESHDRFVIAIVPRWLRKKMLHTYYHGHDLSGDEWSDEDHQVWKRLSGIVRWVDHQISSADKPPTPKKKRSHYGSNSPWYNAGT